MSATRQSKRGGPADARNTSAEANGSARMPAERITSTREQHIASSSSMTPTKGPLTTRRRWSWRHLPDECGGELMSNGDVRRGQSMLAVACPRQSLATDDRTHPHADWNPAEGMGPAIGCERLRARTTESILGIGWLPGLSDHGENSCLNQSSLTF